MSDAAAVTLGDKKAWPDYAQSFFGRMIFFLLTPAAIIKSVQGWYGIHLSSAGDSVITIYKSFVHGFVDLITFFPLHWLNFHIGDVTKDLIAVSIAMEAIAISSVTNFRKKNNDYTLPESPWDILKEPFEDTSIVWQKLVERTPPSLHLFALIELAITIVKDLLSIPLSLFTVFVYFGTRRCMKCAIFVEMWLSRIFFGMLFLGLFNLVQQPLNYFRFKNAEEVDEWGFWYKQSAIHFAWYLLATLVVVVTFFQIFGK